MREPFYSALFLGMAYRVSAFPNLILNRPSNLA